MRLRSARTHLIMAVVGGSDFAIGAIFLAHTSLHTWMDIFLHGMYSVDHTLIWTCFFYTVASNTRGWGSGTEIGPPQGGEMHGMVNDGET